MRMGLMAAAAAAIQAVQAATITSPAPGTFIERPAWVGVAAVPATQTPGNANFDRSFRRIDGALFASMLASEEAYWERFWLWSPDSRRRRGVTLSDDVGFLFRPVPTSAYGTAYADGHGAFPSPAAGSSRHASTVADRAVSTRRIYRPALDWMLHNFLLSPVRNEPFFWNSLRDLFLVFDEANPPTSGAPTAPVITANISTYSTGARILSSTLIDPTGSTFLPSADWTAVEDAISAITWNTGGRTLESCAAGDVFRGSSATPELSAALAPAIADILFNSGFFKIGTPAQMQQFLSDHAVTSPGRFSDVLNQAFGSAIDYGALTNESRRLTFDRLAAMNRTAAALDRTYCMAYTTFDVSRSWPMMTYSVSGGFAGTVPASAISASGGTISVDGSMISWASVPYAATTVESTYTDDFGQPYPTAAISGAQCEAGASATDITLKTVIVDPDIFDQLIYQADEGQTIIFHVDPLLLTEAGGATYLSYSVSRPGDFPVEHREAYTLSVPGSAQVFITGQAGYSYTRSPTPGANPALDGSPLPEDWASIRSFEWCAMESLLTADTLDGFWRGDATAKEIRIKHATPSDGAGFASLLRSTFQEGVDKARTCLENLTGLTIGNTAELQSLASSAASTARASLSFNAGYSVSAPDGGLDAYVHVDSYSGGVISKSVTYSDGQGRAGTLLLDLNPSANASTTMTNVAAQVFHGYEFERADWSFSTLRMNQ